MESLNYHPAMTTSPRQPGRRDLLTAAALGSVGLAGCAARSKARGRTISPGSVVLFQGDSITDAGRDREAAGRANEQPALGSGYASIAATDLLVAYPEHDLRIYNRGISGNKVFQLAERWDEDCLALEPDVLSILIGVNDIWHARNGNYDGTVETYERDYDALLRRTLDARPGLMLVVCEPFVLQCGAVDASWFPEFDNYRAAARAVANRHGATWVPFQQAFDAALDVAPAEYWAGDGVHPSPAGAALMAQTWLRATGMA